MHDMVALWCEYDKDGIEQTQEREGWKNGKKFGQEKVLANQIPDSISGDDACYEWYTKVLCPT